MKIYKIKTQSFCHWCDYYNQRCRKGHKCKVYKKHAKKQKDRKNIFDLPMEEFDLAIEGMLKNTSPEELLKALKECGLELKEEKGE